MLIRGQPWREYLAQHPDGIVLVMCIICGIAGVAATWI